MNRFEEKKFVEWCLWGAQHPVAWMEAAFNITLPSCERKIVEATATHDMVAVMTGQAVGKTFTSQMIAAWHAICRRGLVLVAAPSWFILEQQWWPGLSGLICEKFGVKPVDMQKKRWLLPGETLRGILPINAENPQSLRGFHSPTVLLIEDEASEVADDAFNEIMGSQISRGVGEARVLLLSNPTRTTGHFAMKCRDPAWHVIRISSYDSPNITGEMKVPGLATLEGIEALKREWGEDSPAFKSKVLGLFSETGEYDRYFNEALLLAAMEEDTSLPAAPQAAGRRQNTRPVVRVQGVDVAMYGNDNTVSVILDIVPACQSDRRQTAIVASVAFLPGGRDVTEVVSWVENRHRENGCALTVYDATAGGWGLGSLARKIPVHGVHFARAASNKRWANKRTEYYAALLDAFRTKRLKIPMNAPQRLLEDLRSIRYKVTTTGATMLEPKERLKDRIGRSCDYSDALALAVSALDGARGMTPVETVRQQFEKMLARFPEPSQRGGF